MSLNTFSTISTVDYPYNNSNLNQNVSSCAIRVKYIGPLVERAGLVYVQQYTTNLTDLAQDNLLRVHESPHGFIRAVDENYVYLRRKTHEINKQLTAPTAVTFGHLVIIGLPISSACLMVEWVVHGEFYPSQNDAYLSLATSAGMLSSNENV